MLKQSRFVLPATLLLLTLGIQLSARTHASLMAGVFRFAGPAAASVAETDRDRDGLNGPVRRIKTEMVKLLPKGGQLVEGPRQLLETASYDMKGAKIDYAFFPTATDSLTGKEVYKYDDRGNIAEMTLLNADGSVLSKETYQYEFDRIGNWTKMTSLVAVVENGQMIFEPKEVTYRTITYYLEDSVAKTMQPAANQPAASAPAAASSPASAAAPKQQPSITPVKMEVATNNSGGTTAAPGTTAMRATDNATANPAPANSAANVPAPQQGVTNNGPAPANVAANNSAAPKQSTPANAPASAPVGVTVTAQAASPLTTMVSTSANLTMKAPEKKPEEVAANTNAPSNSNKGNSVTSGTAEAESAPKPLRGVPVKPISGGVLNGRAVELPKPEYPEIARRARTTGIVAVEVVIDVSGKVLSAKAISGPSMLHRAAEQAAQRAKFTPTLLSGQPVKMTGTINYNFSF